MITMEAGSAVVRGASASMFVRMDHVALSVRDMERAIAFYGNTLGFQVVFDRVFTTEMARLIGEPEVEVRIVHLRLEGAMLELFHYRTPEGRARPEGQRQCDLGLTHIGFIVSDFDATHARLCELGVSFLGEAVEIRPGVRVAYFHGAEGEVCEMREILPAGS
jgi:catechol 2,3-dioxygenase-like lactoylglutathione lyase family enzyme